MDKDKKEKKPTSSGGLSFGTEIILFLIVIFIIWILTGGPEKQNSEELSPNKINKEIQNN